jgi:hypothetical protein
MTQGALPLAASEDRSPTIILTIRTGTTRDTRAGSYDTEARPVNSGAEE